MFCQYRIGTFRISRNANAVVVRDADKFNNWGSKYFPDMPTAKAWAHLGAVDKLLNRKCPILGVPVSDGRL